MRSNVLIGIIDDDASLCRSLGRLLHQAGYESLSFSSAEDFLARREPGAFSCLLVDIELGGLTGIELHRQLLAENDHTPVVYITALDDPEALAQALRQGCAAFFRKTDAGPEILETVRRITSWG